MAQIILYAAISFTVFIALALLMAPMLLRPSPEAARVLAVVTSNRPDRRRVSGKEQAQEKLLDAARALRARLGLAENPKLIERLNAAGLRYSKSADYFFAAQFLGPLVLGFAASFIPDNTVFFVIAAAVVGYIAPDFWVDYKIKARRKRIRRSIPDAVDLLVICVDAGLGLDQALLRIGEELALSHPDINEEFSQVHLEQRAGTQRIEAWQSLAHRTRIEEFSSFVSMLSQADRFGTPIIKSLIRFSEDLRMKRRQHAEQAAAKTKIKIIFPLVLFIFPTIFIVLLAPAMLSIGEGLKSMSGGK